MKTTKKLTAGEWVLMILLIVFVGALLHARNPSVPIPEIIDADSTEVVN